MGYVYYLLPLLLELVCIIHAVKTGRVFPWVYVIVFLPAVGSLAYLAVELVPDMMRSRTSHQLAQGMRTAADPNRGFRQAKRAAELVGSIDSKRAYADQLVERSQYPDAIAIYQGLLTGQFENDPAILQRLARAQFLSGDAASAQITLERLRAADPNFMSADLELLYARSLELQSKDAEALAVYRKIAPVFAGEEARARYGMLLQKVGAHDEARAQFKDILQSLEGAPGHYRRAQREWAAIARAGLK